MNSIFDQYYKKYDSWYDKNRYAYLSELEALKKVIPLQGKGLEIGVGTGRFAAPLGITIGIDPSMNMIKIAEQRDVIVLIGRGECLPFQNSSYDYIAIIVTLCFVKDPVNILNEAMRVLKKNGHIILGIIDKNSSWGRYYQKKKNIFYKQANFYDVLWLTDLLKHHGIKNIVYYQTLFHLPTTVNHIEKSQKGFGKGGFIVLSGKKQ